MNKMLVIFVSILILGAPASADLVVPSDRVVSGVFVRDIETDRVIGALLPGSSAVYIDQIPRFFIVELESGVKGKVAKSWTVKISEHGESTLTIATFNIQIFGATKASKDHVMSELAAIVKSYDIVAIQEIRDATGRVPLKFLEFINDSQSRFSYELSDRGGREADDRGSQEQYAFYYNKDSLEVLSAGKLFDDSVDDLFQREPYIARFKSRRGNLTFALITVHTRPESAVEEIKALHVVAEAAREEFEDEENFIILGDFNAGCQYASPTDFIGHPIKDNYSWIVSDDADTNFAVGSACAYDRILTTRNMVDAFTGEWGVGTVSSKEVSDHFPVWAKFRVAH